MCPALRRGSAGAEDIQDASQTRGQATRTFQMAREHVHPGIVPEEPDRKLSRRLPPQDLPTQPVSCPARSRPQCLLSACGCQPHAGRSKWGQDPPQGLQAASDRQDRAQGLSRGGMSGLQALHLQRAAGTLSILSPNEMMLCSRYLTLLNVSIKTTLKTHSPVWPVTPFKKNNSSFFSISTTAVNKRGPFPSLCLETMTASCPPTQSRGPASELSAPGCPALRSP